MAGGVVARGGRWAVNASLLAGALVLSLFLGEGLLALIGVPDSPPLRVAHPPAYEELREFIEFRYRFRTNDRGLRDRQRAARPAHGERRVVVLGDSYTEGLGVEDADRFSDRLEAEFGRTARPISFINAGLSGTGPHYYARVFKHVGLGYAPQGVLVCIFANDVANTPESPHQVPLDPPSHRPAGIAGLVHAAWPRLDTLLRTLKTRIAARREAATSDYVAEVSRRARERGIPQERIDAWVASLPSRVVEAINAGRFGFGVLAYGLLYPDFWIDALDVATPRAERKWQSMVGALETIHALAEGAGAEVAVVYLPVHFQYDPDAHASEYIAVRTGTRTRRDWLTGSSEVERRLGAWAQGHGIPYLSLTQTFRQARTRGEAAALDYPLDGHWTPAGHAVAARGIAGWLRGQGIFGIAP